MPHHALLPSFLTYGGILVSLVGYVMFLVAAFGEGILWGILCFFFWPVQLLFLVTHWYNARKAFLVQVVGIGMIVAGALLEPGVRTVTL